MIGLTLGAVADVVGGDLADLGAADVMVSAVAIDSRAVVEGALFVALPGEHADGHDYVDDALARGAAGALVEQGRGRSRSVEVDDPADALLGLGAWVRDTVDPMVVAVTGSSGKTTTKDLIRAAVSASRRTVANVGSYNNELGVPLTCCELGPDTEVLVAEVGARGVGHIAAMASVLRPDVGVITNVGSAHLEMFADLDGVARAKSELVQSLGASAVAVLNADDPLVRAMASVTAAQVVTYGVAPDADLRATDIVLDERACPTFTVEGVRVAVPLPGAHNVSNALAALAAARACGVNLEDAVDALADASVSRWRMELAEGPGGVRVLNDAYNANPSSMAVALRTLAAMAVTGRRWAVLGHMAELGAGSAAAHLEIGRLCAQLHLDGLVVVGAAARAIHDGAMQGGFAGELLTVDSPEDAVIDVGRRLQRGDAVLVKASRSVGLERVAVALATREDAA
jgi:UDP-N-acetylmuramoyl-tripeptide--D-alanyl-D-alanine ligase